jgi:hypothetical protein
MHAVPIGRNGAKNLRVSSSSYGQRKGSELLTSPGLQLTDLPTYPNAGGSHGEASTAFVEPSAA